MDERTLQRIKELLQSKEAQERIGQNIQRGREQASVKIGNAARLFGFTENQLRDWEKSGLLKPSRSTKPESPEQEGKSPGQRQYSLAELDKLAIIKELMDAGLSPGGIPGDVDTIWNEIFPSDDQETLELKSNESDIDHMPIDDRVEFIYHNELFWRYYVSSVLRLSLMLICEDIPGYAAALILPLQTKHLSASVRQLADLSEIGESLIGWLGQTRSFYTFLTSAPSFKYPSDYRVYPLRAIDEDVPRDSTLIVVERRARSLILNDAVVETVRHLLTPIYENIPVWCPCFSRNLHDLTYPAIDFNDSTNPSDMILDGLADMIVRLGGRLLDGRDRWRFCCILLPKEPWQPLQQRSLVVRAQSKHAPHKIGVTTVSPTEPLIGLSLKAFQSGHVIYQHEISKVKNPMIAHREKEGPIRSAIAVPIGAEVGQPLAVLYVVSDEPDAFSASDQHLLRMIGRIIEEVLLTYHARQQVTQSLGDLIEKPMVIDRSFGDFLSENEFIRDVEKLLVAIKSQIGEWKEPLPREEVPLAEREARYRAEQLSGEVISLIAIDIDNQSNLANKYGDRITRNLSMEIGQKIQKSLPVLFKEHLDCQLYHIYADRFYLLLKRTPLEKACEIAERLRQALKGSYKIDALRLSVEDPLRIESMLDLEDVTVRLGVSSYGYKKLGEILQRYPFETAVVEVRTSIALELDEALARGKNKGGNIVIAWHPQAWEYRPSSAPK